MRMNHRRFALAACVVTVGLSFTGVAGAQSPIEKMKQMKVANTNLDIPVVEQSGRNADAIKANLKRVKLPPGFEISLFAIVPDARHMAVAPSTNMLFVGTRKTTVWAVTDRNSDGIADEVKPFANSLKFKVPNGVCWTKDGFLVVVEHNRILNFPAAEFFYEGPDVAVIEVVKQGGLVPPEEESYNHGARTCRVSSDGKLYVTLGQPYNVQPKEKIELYEKLGIGGVIRMDAFSGEGREVVARGLRNPVGIEIANDGTVWTTDNQTDGMGDDTPPGKLSHHTKMGAHHGYPWVIGETKITDAAAGYELSKMPTPKDIQKPVMELPPHAADLGLAQYNHTAFPKKYQGAFFIAEHGSWNRTTPIGARVMVATLKPDGSADKLEPFAEGWLDDKTRTYRGRPVDVAVMKDGSLLVSDDYAGAIYRISYVGQ